MNMFEEVSEIAMSMMKGWIKIYDPKNQWTIESFAKANYDETKIKPHCVECTIVNQCWFKDEENKKPEEFDYSKYSVSEIPLEKRGLYHPNCHDRKQKIQSPRPSEIYIFDLERRMDYLFDKKRDWLKTMGYTSEDKQEVFQILERLSMESYCKGEYINNPPEESKKKYGFRIRIKISFPGKREMFGRVFPLTSSYIVYPNGKLKNNTPIGGKIK